MAERVIPSRRAGVAARRRKVVLVLALVLCVAALSVTATYTPLFAAEEIRVDGASRLRPADIARLAGVEEGTNVFHLDTASAERALSADPWIERAVVERELPDAIAIRIEEREPVARARGGVYAADATRLPGAGAGGLPAIEALSGSLAPTDLAAAARAAGALAPSVRAQVVTIEVELDDELVLQLDGGARVFYGPPSDDGQKAEALRALLRWVEEQGVRIVSADVSVPSAPTARPVDGASVPIS